MHDKPFIGWVWDEELQSWVPPTPRPSENHVWDEDEGEQGNWVELP